MKIALLAVILVCVVVSTVAGFLIAWFGMKKHSGKELKSLFGRRRTADSGEKTAASSTDADVINEGAAVAETETKDDKEKADAECSTDTNGTGDSDN